MSNEAENSYVTLTAKSVCVALAVLLLLMIGGGFNTFYFDMLFGISDKYGFFYLWGVMIWVTTLLIGIPFGMMIIHGLKFLNPINVLNATLQLMIATAYGVIETDIFNPIWLLALCTPIASLYLLHTSSYKNFVEFYYVLQSNRRQERRRLKELTKHR